MVSPSGTSTNSLVKVRAMKWADKTHEFRKRDLEHVMQISKSTMPERPANQLTSRADFLDLMRFVMAADWELAVMDARRVRL